MTTSTVVADDSVATQPRAPAMTFREEVESRLPMDSRLVHCIQCGTCSGSCPSGPDMDHTPRQIFAMIEAGMKDEVLKSNTPWYCVSCYYCTVRCPQEVQITEIMYSLKRGAIQEGYFREESVSDASDFSGTFIDLVENYGRSFELGLATRYHLRHHPLGAMKMATGLGLGMLRKGRMDLTPNRIRGMNQLKAILAEAKSIGGTT